MYNFYLHFTTVSRGSKDVLCICFSRWQFGEAKLFLSKTAVNMARRATLTNSSDNTDANNVKEWLGFLLGLANAERCFEEQV